MKIVQDYIKSHLKTSRMKILSSAAKYPLIAITLVIMISTLLLPLVSATALMPAVALFHIGNYLESKGLLFVVYSVCIQGLLLTTVLTLLYSSMFMIAAVGNVVHLKYFSPKKTRK